MSGFIVIPGAVIGAAMASGAGYVLYVNAVTREARRVYGFSSDEADAFAHAYASAHLASLLNPSVARVLGDFRETDNTSSNPNWDTYRDLYNNEVGRQISTYLGTNWSPNALESLVVDAMRGGDLIVRSDDARIPGGFSGSPWSFDTNAAAWRGPGQHWTGRQSNPQYSPIPECFLVGTPILMADGTEKPIEEVEAGDMVMAFDGSADGGRGPLVPRRVTRTFTNVTQEVIDLHGVKVTPGHRFLNGEGGFETILSILRRDGTLVHRDGRELRARTNLPVGSPGDRVVAVVDTDPATGTARRLKVRGGMPLHVRDGRVWSLGERIVDRGGEIRPDGLVRLGGRDGPAVLPEEDLLGSSLQRGFVVEGPDGRPFIPEWITGISEVEDAAAIGQAGGQTSSVCKAPRSFRGEFSLAASRSVPLNRSARRKNAAPSRVQ